MGELESLCRVLDAALSLWIVLLADTCHFAKPVLPPAFGRIILTLGRNWQKYTNTKQTILNHFSFLANVLDICVDPDRLEQVCGYLWTH
jgi:hypothetical protein